MDFLPHTLTLRYYLLLHLCIHEISFITASLTSPHKTPVSPRPPHLYSTISIPASPGQISDLPSLSKMGHLALCILALATGYIKGIHCLNCFCNSGISFQPPASLSAAKRRQWAAWPTSLWRRRIPSCTGARVTVSLRRRVAQAQDSALKREILRWFVMETVPVVSRMLYMVWLGW